MQFSPSMIVMAAVVLFTSGVDVRNACNGVYKHFDRHADNAILRVTSDRGETDASKLSHTALQYLAVSLEDCEFSPEDMLSALLFARTFRWCGAAAMQSRLPPACRGAWVEPDPKPTNQAEAQTFWRRHAALPRRQRTCLRCHSATCYTHQAAPASPRASAALRQVRSQTCCKKFTVFKGEIAPLL